MDSTGPSHADTRKWMLIALIAAVVAFLVGFGWQYMRARGLAGDLEVAERSAAFNGLEATLGAATIEAQRGSYELARQHASDFFSTLQTEIGDAPESATTALQQVLGERDAMITALSRSNPQAGPLLAQMFNRYRVAMGKSVGPRAIEPTTPPAADSLLPVDSPRDTVSRATTGS
jgi:hypothetical protein